MKKFLFLLAFMPLVLICILSLAGCSRDMNGVLYSKYPIVNRAYRTYADSLGNYTVFWFESNGNCKKEVLNFGNSVKIENNYSYWMERETFITQGIVTKDSIIYMDSLFVRAEMRDNGETDTTYRGCFYDTYITLQSDMLIRYR